MPNEVLTLSGDSSPLGWGLYGGGSAHYLNLSTVNARGVSAIFPDITDKFHVSNPVAAFTDASVVRFQLTMGNSARTGAVSYGFHCEVYDGATFENSVFLTLPATVPNGTTFNVDVPVTMTEAEVDNMQVAIRSGGSGWGFGGAIIRVDKLDLLLTYNVAPSVGLRINRFNRRSVVV